MPMAAARMLLLLGSSVALQLPAASLRAAPAMLRAPQPPRVYKIVCDAASPEPSEPLAEAAEEEAPKAVDKEKLALVERAGDPFRAVRVVLYVVFGVAGLAGVVTSLLQMGSDPAAAQNLGVNAGVLAAGVGVFVFDQCAAALSNADRRALNHLTRACALFFGLQVCDCQAAREDRKRGVCAHDILHIAFAASSSPFSAVIVHTHTHTPAPSFIITHSTYSYLVMRSPLSEPRPLALYHAIHEPARAICGRFVRAPFFITLVCCPHAPTRRSCAQLSNPYLKGGLLNDDDEEQ